MMNNWMGLGECVDEPTVVDQDRDAEVAVEERMSKRWSRTSKVKWGRTSTCERQGTALYMPTWQTAPRAYLLDRRVWNQKT